MTTDSNRPTGPVRLAWDGIVLGSAILGTALAVALHLTDGPTPSAGLQAMRSCSHEARADPGDRPCPDAAPRALD